MFKIHDDLYFFRSDGKNDDKKGLFVRDKIKIIKLEYEEMNKEVSYIHFYANLYYGNTFNRFLKNNKKSDNEITIRSLEIQPTTEEKAIIFLHADLNLELNGEIKKISNILTLCSENEEIKFNYDNQDQVLIIKKVLFTPRAITDDDGFDLILVRTTSGIDPVHKNTGVYVTVFGLPYEFKIVTNGNSPKFKEKRFSDFIDNHDRKRKIDATGDWSTLDDYYGL